VTTPLAVFDFDGTLFTRNSPLDFTRFALPAPAFLAGMASFLPFYALFRAGLLDDGATKARFLRTFYRDHALAELQAIADCYATSRIPGQLDPFHQERLRYHQQAGHEVVIVTATFDFVLEPWCRRTGVGLIATEAEVIAGRVTGRLVRGNCYGANKVTALQRRCLTQGRYLFAYGDSPSDLPLLRLADEAYLRGRGIDLRSRPAPASEVSGP
jgi:HAD superfamily hydrolase (TIGR01490 family)